MAYQNAIFTNAIPSKSSNLENETISSPIFNRIMIIHTKPNFSIIQVLDGEN